MFLLIANAFFLAAGIVLVAFQTVEITSKRVKPAMKLKVFSITGCLCSLPSFPDVVYCQSAAAFRRPEDDFDRACRRVHDVRCLHRRLVLQKRILVKTVFDNRKPQPRIPISGD